MSGREGKKNIILTGFMGTGKTSVAAILASDSGRCYVDTDRLIEEACGLKISQIFEQYGEEFFRDQETEILSTLPGYPPGSLVVATGGGAVLRGKNREIMQKAGIVILLTASPQAIIERLAETTDRPLLSGPQPAEKINELLQERKGCYSVCDISIDTTGRSPEEIAMEISFLMGDML